ncbi:unnamed protein product, partial [Mesorhabditis spiculigera]
MEPRWWILIAAVVGVALARQTPRLHDGSYEMLFSHETEKSGIKVPLIPSSNTLFPEAGNKEKSGSQRRREEKEEKETTDEPEVTTLEPETTTKEILCLDFDENCDRMQPLCENPLYHVMTTKKCAKTCNKCEEFQKLPYGMRCKDVLKTCSTRMCESDFYDLVYKKHKCARTAAHRQMAATMAKAVEAPLKRIMMCRPTHFQVSYAINPWMDMRRGVNKPRALEQWDELKHVLTQAGAQIHVMEPQAGSENLPDMVFCANAAVIRGKKAYLANFHFDQRKPERQHNKVFLEGEGYECVGSEALAFEGAGDALWAGKDFSTLLVGVGPRSDPKILPDLRKEFDDYGVRIVGCNLLDPRFYHIDTCFCPLNDEAAIWFPHAFDGVTQWHIKSTTGTIEVDDREAKNFACNSVVVGKTVVMNKGSQRIADTLHKLGFEVAQVDMSEFIKAGGSAKCCTLAL